MPSANDISRVKSLSMMYETQDLKNEFSRFRDLKAIQDSENTTSGKPALKLIAGDASDRKFYRLINSDLSAICMQFPKWEGGYGGDPLSWLGMHHALNVIGVPVPEIYLVDEKTCCIWTEDFGDHFLNCRFKGRVLDISNADSQETLDFYRQSLDLLVRAQYPNVPPPPHPAQKLAFDTDKLMFEMKFFITHFLNGLLNLKAEENSTAWQPLFNEFHKLSETLDRRERVLCHRDYHVRNVMIVDNKAKWIDFQDARMGPHTYDVVSIVRDSYMSITTETRDYLYDYYFAQVNKARQAHRLSALESADYQREILLMGLQRNIKAIGSFGYLATVKKKPGYLRYVDDTLDTLNAEESLVTGGLNLMTEFPAITTLLRRLHKGDLHDAVQHAIRSFL